MMLERRRVAELMDDGEVDPAELARSLRDLRWVNRWLLGGRPAVAHVLRLARRVPNRPVRLLDVGTGAADIPLRVAGRARRAGIEMRIVATDFHPATLDLAARAVTGVAEISVEPADALALPYEDQSFDIAMSNTMLHHLDSREAIQAVRELGRVARYGIVVTDLRRSVWALAATRLLAATIWRGHPVTRHDGPASIRAAYTPSELADMTSAALADPFRVHRHALFRLAMVADRTGELTSDPGSRAAS